MSPAAVEAQKPARLGNQVRANILRQLGGVLAEADAVVVVKVERVPTRDLNQLRRSLQGGLMMVKNSLGRLAFRQRGWADLEKLLEGTCGVGAIRGDVAAASKQLVQFAKDHEGFALRGGLLAGRVLSAQELRALAGLPSREVLLSHLAGVLQSPLRNLAFLMNGPIRSLALALSAVAKKKETESHPKA